MKLTKKQQQFIIEATTNSDVCSQWRTNIKETFPKLFKETEYKEGDWEFSSMDYADYITGH